MIQIQFFSYFDLFTRNKREEEKCKFRLKTFLSFKSGGRDTLSRRRSTLLPRQHSAETERDWIRSLKSNERRRRMVGLCRSFEHSSTFSRPTLVAASRNICNFTSSFFIFSISIQNDCDTVQLSSCHLVFFL